MSIRRVQYILVCFVFGIVFIYTQVYAQGINSTGYTIIPRTPTLYERGARLGIYQGWFESDNHFSDRIDAEIKKNEERYKKYQEVYKKLYQSDIEARARAEKIMNDLRKTYIGPSFLQIMKEADEADKIKKESAEIKKKLQEQREKDRAAREMLSDAVYVVSLRDAIARDEESLDRLPDPSDTDTVYKVSDTANEMSDRKNRLQEKIKFFQQRIKTNERVVELYIKKYCSDKESPMCKSFIDFFISEKNSRAALRAVEQNAREREADKAEEIRIMKKTINRDAL